MYSRKKRSTRGPTLTVCLVRSKTYSLDSWWNFRVSCAGEKRNLYDQHVGVDAGDPHGYSFMVVIRVYITDVDARTHTSSCFISAYIYIYIYIYIHILYL